MKLFDPIHPTPDTPAHIGGKGNNLLRMMREGFPVPPWVALPVSAWLEALAQDRLGDRLAAELAGLDESNPARIAEKVRALLLAAPPPPGLREALAAHPLLQDPEATFAVRSSAADEDGVHLSFAGIHESFLHVRGIDSILEHVQRVWASGYQERALRYRRAHGLALHPVPMAVIVQRMVDARVAGVLFTADPVSGNPHEVVISALWGLGEGLVGAGLPADEFRLSKRGGALRYRVVRKETKLVRDAASGGLRSEAVPAEEQEHPSLTEAQCRALVGLGLRLENLRRRPQDIEFCMDAAGAIHLLQTRAITTLQEDGPAAGNRLVWDNSNIIESYSGVTTPMTFSFIRHAYTVVYHCFSQVMGIPERVVAANREVYGNMLGLIRGQVYYNLMNWYRLIRQFPGYAMNKRHMEAMMGLRERFDPEDEAAAPLSPARKWLVEFPATLRLLLRMATHFACLDRTVARFQSDFAACYARWEAMDFDAMAPHELMAVYRDMERRLLWNWHAPIINDFYVMIHYGLLRAICRNWCGDAEGTLQNDLICGNGDIESTEPTRILMRLARRIRQHPDWRARFQTSTPRQLAQQIPADPACAEIADTLRRYLQRYGFRCVNELKLEEPSLHETPEFLYQILQNYLAVDESLLDADAMEARERGIRDAAEARARAALASHPLRRLLFRHVLAAARKGVRNRENLRFARTRIYGILRQLLLALDRQFHAAGLLEAPRDIFYLAIEEVWDYVKGTAITTDLRGLVALRRREFETHRAAPPPADHFETYGMVYHRNLYREWKPAEAASGDLRGTGCCPGEVTAPVRIVHSPRDDLDLTGCILAAGRTDPGWVPLYPAVRGILIERGSILSHSAIVAREMGIPAIVGIPGLLTSLRDGQVVRMNGTTGTVVLL